MIEGSESLDMGKTIESLELKGESEIPWDCFAVVKSTISEGHSIQVSKYFMSYNESELILLSLVFFSTFLYHIFTWFFELIFLRHCASERVILISESLNKNYTAPFVQVLNIGAERMIPRNHICWKNKIELIRCNIHVPLFEYFCSETDEVKKT